MNILMIRSNPVEPDSRVEKEAYTLMNQGHSVSILAWDRASEYALKKEKKIIFGIECEIYRVGIRAGFGGGFKKNLIPLLRFQKEIIMFLIKQGAEIDVIHACDFDTAFASYLFKNNKKFVYDIFDYYVDSFSVPKCLKKIISTLEDYISNHCDALILCTEERKEQLGNLKQDKCYIIHNTPMKICSVQRALCESKNIKIVYVGILGNNRFIKELIEVVKKHHEIELHIAGFGKLENYIEHEAAENINICFYGKIPYEQTLALEDECDIMTAIYDPKVPNHKFAAPNKFYESVMLGKPVIMIKNTGMSNVVSEYGLGAVIEYSQEELEKAIIDISDNIIEWRNKSCYIKELYEKDYSWEKMAARLEELYAEI